MPGRHAVARRAAGGSEEIGSGGSIAAAGVDRSEDINLALPAPTLRSYDSSSACRASRAIAEVSSAEAVCPR